MYRAYLQRGSAGIRVNFHVRYSEKRAHAEAQAGVQDVNLSFTASLLYCWHPKFLTAGTYVSEKEQDTETKCKIPSSLHVHLK